MIDFKKTKSRSKRGRGWQELKKYFYKYLAQKETIESLILLFEKSIEFVVTFPGKGEGVCEKEGEREIETLMVCKRGKVLLGDRYIGRKYSQ